MFKVAPIVLRLDREEELNHLAKRQKKDKNIEKIKISELEESINLLRKELQNKQKRK